MTVVGFLFDFFSTSSAVSIFPKKVIGPDVLENILGRPGGSGSFDFFDFSDDRCTKSSFGKKTGYMFLSVPNKCLRPGASEKPFGPSRGVRRGPGSRLRGPGALRTGPGGILGGSWALLGRSWSDL